MSEDCLTINVIRPSGMGKAEPLPVMVWIYGGALTSGESSSVDDTHLVAQSIRMVREATGFVLTYASCSVTHY